MLKRGFGSRGTVRIEELAGRERMSEVVVGEVVYAVVEKVRKMVKMGVDRW